jgi:hypothetical protein
MAGKTQAEELSMESHGRKTNRIRRCRTYQKATYLHVYTTIAAFHFMTEVWLKVSWNQILNTWHMFHRTLLCVRQTSKVGHFLSLNLSVELFCWFYKSFIHQMCTHNSRCLNWLLAKQHRLSCSRSWIYCSCTQFLKRTFRCLCRRVACSQTFQCVKMSVPKPMAVLIYVDEVWCTCRSNFQYWLHSVLLYIHQCHGYYR